MYSYRPYVESGEWFSGIQLQWYNLHHSTVDVEDDDRAVWIYYSDLRTLSWSTHSLLVGEKGLMFTLVREGKRAHVHKH